MKKFATLALALATSVAVSAYDYPYLTFVATDGTVTSVSVEGLRLSVANGQLVAVNAVGETAFELTSLTKMYFANQATGVASVSDNTGQSAIHVVSMAGVAMGRFDSVAEAKATLPSGVYIVKSAKGIAKIVLK